MFNLTGVKPGDKLKTRSCHWGSQFDTHVVERVTKTLAVCKYASFRIDNGLKIGTGNYSRGKVYASFATEQDFAEANMERRIQTARAALSKIKIDTNTIDQAEALIAASKTKDGA